MEPQIANIQTLIFNNHPWTFEQIPLSTQKTVWVGKQDQHLHLKVLNIDGKLCFPKLTLSDSLGHGRYIFYVASRIDLMNRNLALKFQIQDDSSKEDKQPSAKVQFSKRGNEKKTMAQFGVEPYKDETTKYDFPFALNGFYSTVIIDWTSARVHFEMLHDHSDYAPEHYMRLREFVFGDQIKNVGQKFTVSLEPFMDDEGKQSQVQVKEKGLLEIIVKNFKFIKASSK